MASDHPILHHRESSVPPLLKPSPSSVGSPTGLVQNLHPRDLREPYNLVQHVATQELDSGGGGLAAELVGQDREPAHAVVAVGVGEVISALEEPSHGGLATPCSGLKELGFGGL